MTDLTPVGLSKDGTTLVLVSARGAEFRVRVDHRLRTALDGNRSRTEQSRTSGRWETTMESTLRPRDIQARIRAGESAEQVAAAAQTTVERIMAFAGPVLAERAHVAQTAQRCSVRRHSAETAPVARTLGDAALAQLRPHGLHEEDLDWDSWRRDDGRWALTADFTLDGDAQHAEFVYDLRGRYVIAENDVARMLTGEQAPAAATAPSGPRRLAAVPSQEELPLGDDAIELVRDRDHEPTVEVTPGGADAHDESGSEVDSPAEAQDAFVDDDAAADDVSDAERAVATARRPIAARRKGRASVPSWDEIMFGGGGPE